MKWIDREGFFQGLYWSIKIAFPLALGRWYVFREAPTWYVMKIADGDWSKFERTPILDSFIAQAQRERELRLSNIIARYIPRE